MCVPRRFAIASGGSTDSCSATVAQSLILRRRQGVIPFSTTTSAVVHRSLKTWITVQGRIAAKRSFFSDGSLALRVAARWCKWRGKERTPPTASGSMCAPAHGSQLSQRNPDSAICGTTQPCACGAKVSRCGLWAGCCACVIPVAPVASSLIVRRNLSRLSRAAPNLNLRFPVSIQVQNAAYIFAAPRLNGRKK